MWTCTGQRWPQAQWTVCAYRDIYHMISCDLFVGFVTLWSVDGFREFELQGTGEQHVLNLKTAYAVCTTH